MHAQLNCAAESSLANLKRWAQEVGLVVSTAVASMTVYDSLFSILLSTTIETYPPPSVLQSKLGSSNFVPFFELPA